MNTAGIDVGSLWTKVVIVREGEILSSASILTGDDNASAAENALGFALKKLICLLRISIVSFQPVRVERR
ncbi:MAG: hypothetical protein ACXQS7_02870 [Candidatus Syntropharchaeia archaeon]